VRILSLKPGHDGAAAYVEDGHPGLVVLVSWPDSVPRRPVDEAVPPAVAVYHPTARETHRLLARPDEELT
jgi:hypothetical protein